MILQIEISIGICSEIAANMSSWCEIGETSKKKEAESVHFSSSATIFTTKRGAERGIRTPDHQFFDI